MIDTEPRNLDAMDAADLESFAQDVNNPMALRDYARRKARAIRYRLGGMISSALICESDCETLYNKLPIEYRW